VTEIVLAPARPADADIEAFRTAIADDLETLAMLHDHEPDATVLGALGRLGFPTNFGLRLTDPEAIDVAEGLAAVIAAMPTQADATLLDELAADFTQIYLSYGLRAAPTESVWLDKENLERQQPMFEVREFYRRHGLQVVDWAMRSDDHLVTEIRFLAHLFGKSDDPNALFEAARFLDAHLLRWIGLFAGRVAQRCATEYFAGLALLTERYFSQLRDVLAEFTGLARPSAEELAQEPSAPITLEDLELPTSSPLTGPTW
jgi:TorA maturation chaperone TorD